MTTEQLIEKLQGLEGHEVRLLVDLDEIEIGDLQCDDENDTVYLIGNC